MSVEKALVLQKTASIERCMLRIGQEYEGHEAELATNFSRQDAIVLNLLRACEQTLDLAQHFIKAYRLAPAKNGRESFDRLVEAEKLPENMAESLKKMVSFRNLAVHEYQSLNVDILRSILEKELGLFQRFVAWALAQPDRPADLA